MESAYYRERAERARRLAERESMRWEMRKALREVARQYEEVADDIEAGRELRHPHLQRRACAAIGDVAEPAAGRNR